jgi:NhaP-type Na+/H+ or K+/H+ antiporter
MSVPHPWLLIFAVTTLLLLLGATSGLVNSRLWISEPLACALFGVAIGPVGVGLLRLDPGQSEVARHFLLEVARFTLAIAVLAAAIRLPPRWLRGNWRGLAAALGPGMVMMWAAGALVTRLCTGLPWLVSVLIGAIVAPTDPVLSAPVVSGELARKSVPEELRNAITAESGINDGLAAPLVLLAVLLVQAKGVVSGRGLADWALDAVVWQVGSAVVVGAAAGFAAKYLTATAAHKMGAERSSLLTLALALALATLAGLQAIGGNGVLGAFVAGAVLQYAYDEEYQEHQDNFNEAITRFFDLPVMVLLGAAAPWAAWRAMGWWAVAFAVGILVLRRMPAWLLLRRAFPWTRSFSENLFVGWFGPIGAAAMFYALEAQQMTGLKVLWPVVSLAACASVLAHGVSGTHLSAMLGDRLDRRENAK